MLIQPQPVDYRQWPYVCFLQMRYPLTSVGAVSVGTGALITPRLILTAGHVVYNFQRGGWATFAQATLGHPRFSLQGIAVRTTPEWELQDSRLPPSAASRSPHDFGVVAFPQAVDDQVQPLPIAPADDPLLLQSLLNVAGFPSTAQPLGTLYGAHAIPTTVGADRIDYPIRTYEGMSGGPGYTFDETSQERTVRAIHTSFVGGEGSAVRVTESVMTHVRQWMQEFPA
jgi:V8-like Glu-specific endopeptidase